MKPILMFTLLLLLPLAAQAQTSSAFAPTPPGDHASQDIPFQSQASREILTLQRAGIVIGFPEGTESLHTREQLSNALGQLLAQIFPPREAVSSAAASREAAQLKNTLSLNLPALAALTHLVSQFSPELTAKGFNVPAIQKELTSFAAGRSLTVVPRFTDVPRSHWAYSAVEALRKAGLIIGEGGGQVN
jgi:hypothetical protein